MDKEDEGSWKLVTATLYYYKNKYNGKMYIGQAVNEKNRKTAHRNDKSDTTFARAKRKYGLDAFEYGIIYQGVTSKWALNQLEYLAINFYYKTLAPNGYNIKFGGDVCSIPESVKLKIGNSNRGKRRSKEDIEKIRVASAGRVHSEESKRKRSEKVRGIKFTEERLTNYRKAIKERGSIPCPAHVKSLFGSEVVDIDNNIIYYSLREAERGSEISRKYISRCCRGIQEAASGTHWKYKKDCTEHTISLCKVIEAKVVNNENRD